MKHGGYIDVDKVNLDTNQMYIFWLLNRSLLCDNMLLRIGITILHTRQQ